MSISVIVPVRDGAATLGRCLARLGEQSRPPDEVIVVDNGSRDGSGDVAREFGRRRPDLRVTVLEEPRPGATVARNRGAAVARGAILAFTDADCEPHRDWLRTLEAAFAPGIGAVAGAVRPSPPTTAVEAFAALYTLRMPDLSFDSRAFTLLAGGFPTANLAVARPVWAAVGGFDETIAIYGEDYDLCARIYAAGHAIRYEASAVVFHHHRATLGGLLRQSFGFGMCHAYLLRRHFRRKLLIELPTVSWQRDDVPGRVWLDLASADKKLAVLLAGALWFPPLVAAAAAYVLYLYLDAGRRFRRDGVPATPAARLAAPALLVAKSAAMTAGRLVGSIRSGTVCL